MIYVNLHLFCHVLHLLTVVLLSKKKGVILYAIFLWIWRRLLLLLVFILNIRMHKL